MAVTQENTAFFQGTGDAKVLSTPALLTVMQQATMDALAGKLPEGIITAGLRVNVDHLIGCEVGSEVAALATLTRIEGRRLIFEAEATSAGQLIGTGRIIRVQVDQESFLERLDPTENA